MSGTHAADRPQLAGGIVELGKEKVGQVGDTIATIGSRAAMLCERGAIRFEAELMALATTRSSRNQIVEDNLRYYRGTVDRLVVESLVRHGHADRPQTGINYWN